VTNVLLSISVARVAPAELYGRFAIAIAAIVAVLTVARQSAGAYLLSLAGASSVDRVRAAGPTLAAQGVMALLAAVGPALLAIVADQPGERSIMIALTLTAPVVLMQDGLRYVASSAAVPGVALLGDTLWLAVFVGGWLLVGTTADSSPLLVSWWGAGALLGYLVLLVSLRQVPRIRNGGIWWRENRATMTRLFGDGLLSAITPLGVVAIIAVALPVAQSAGFLGAATLFGPVNVLLVLFTFVLSAELERVRDRPRAVRVFAIVALLTAVAVMLFTAVLAVMPDRWGRTLLGETWSLASPLLGYRGAEAAALGVLTIIYAYWRWRRLYSLQLWSRLLLAMTTLVGVGVASLSMRTALGVAVAAAVAAFLVLGFSGTLIRVRPADATDRTRLPFPMTTDGP